jgi:hypothetical protein
MLLDESGQGVMGGKQAWVADWESVILYACDILLSSKVVVVYTANANLLHHQTRQLYLSKAGLRLERRVSQGGQRRWKDRWDRRLRAGRGLASQDGQRRDVHAVADMGGYS